MWCQVVLYHTVICILSVGLQRKRKKKKKHGEYSLLPKNQLHPHVTHPYWPIQRLDSLYRDVKLQSL